MIQQAKYLGVSPWELLDLPPESKPYFAEWAEISLVAENEARAVINSRPPKPQLVGPSGQGLARG